MTTNLHANSGMRFLVPHLMLLVLTIQSGLTYAQVAGTTILLPEGLEIQLALQAGPEHVRSEAAVYVFAVNGYRKVRNGKNGFTCLVNRDGNQIGDKDLKPTCWDAEGSRTIVPVMLRVGELIAEQKSPREIEMEIESGFLAGRFSSPQKAGIAYMLRGDLGFDIETETVCKELTPPHYMIYAPGLTNSDIGMDTTTHVKHQALPWVYDGYTGGKRTPYIMVHATHDTNRKRCSK